MTQPETCGAAGGAISFWLRLIDCASSGAGGIITTQGDGGKAGLLVWCRSENGGDMRSKIFIRLSNNCQFHTLRFSFEIDLSTAIRQQKAELR